MGRGVVIGLLRRPALLMRPRPPDPGSRASFELFFRNPIDVPVCGVALHVTEHQLQLDLLDSFGGVVGGALLPRPEIEDRT